MKLKYLEFNDLLELLQNSLPEKYLKIFHVEDVVTKPLDVLEETAHWAEISALKSINSNILSIHKLKNPIHDKKVKSIIDQLTTQPGFEDLDLSGMDQILDTGKKEIVQLLPYLIASYLINYNKNKLIANKDNGFDDIFNFCDNILLKSNYNKNVKSLTQKFSYSLSISAKKFNFQDISEGLYKATEAYICARKEYNNKYENNNSIIVDKIAEKKARIHVNKLSHTLEKYTIKIEPLFLKWNQMYTYCIELCKQIHEVNFTLSTILFVLSAFGALNFESYSEHIFDNQLLDDDSYLESIILEDYLKGSIMKYFHSQFNIAHKAMTKTEIETKTMICTLDDYM